jgi:hypothetical protein
MIEVCRPDQPSLASHTQLHAEVLSLRRQHGSFEGLRLALLDGNGGAVERSGGDEAQSAPRL